MDIEDKLKELEFELRVIKDELIRIALERSEMREKLNEIKRLLHGICFVGLVMGGSVVLAQFGWIDTITKVSGV